MSTSSPPTPPSRALIDGGQRFKTITLPCEWVEDYRPGGYHPVVLGDVVWLARDLIQVAPLEGTRYITRLLGEFEHRGPNGVHKCLVFEPMGPSVNTMVEELPQFKPRRRGRKIRYPLRMAKSILKQSLQALAFLHGNGIAHGDFQPGNILFTLNDID